MTLPCTASKDANPDNTVNHYITNLLRPIDLTGSWEVGLSEVAIPNILVELPPGQLFTVNVDKKKPDGKTTNVYAHNQLKPFHSFENLAKQLNYGIPVCPKRGLPCVFIQFLNGFTRILCQEEAQCRFIGKRICELLGLESGKWYDYGYHESKHAEINTVVHVYCDLVEHVPVGDTLAPCLRTIPIFNQEGDFNVYRFENPHYLPLARTDFSTVEVEFADDMGRNIKFGGNYSFVKLHFRPRKK
jgi:hypothetical protein